MPQDKKTIKPTHTTRHSGESRNPASPKKAMRGPEGPLDPRLRGDDMIKKKDARALAYKILLKITRENLALEEAWDSVKELKHLEPRDRALTRLLVLTTLRQMGFLDSRLKIYAKKLGSLPLDALMALRLGLCQLVFLRTPAHAAINASVNILGGKDKVMRGVVNAVLRKCAANEKPVEDASATWECAIPTWLLESWQKDFGAETAAKIARASLLEPTLDISVKENTAHWQETLSATILPIGTLRLKHQDDITKLPGFADGAWWIQDAAASLPVRLAGDIKGKRVLDLCAAPGGKTAQLLSAGASVTAIDQSEKRLQRLHENLRRLKMDTEIICADVLAYKPKELADIVLLDAPCSATGTLRRHPDLMLHKKPGDAARLGGLQLKLLRHAAGFLKIGGLLIYATCSLQKSEGEAVIESFLKLSPSFKRKPVTAADLNGWQEGVTSAGDLRTLPHMMNDVGGMDGFYAARLEKTS